MVVCHWYGGSKRTIFEVAAPEIRKEQPKACDPLHDGQRRFLFNLIY
jgi:hypothetical protein